uniref:Uncharacterized protein n=1 Tax=Oryza nivara TaxID=4536 RepID=A0A0E0FQZ2_ORYNI
MPATCGGSKSIPGQGLRYRTNTFRSRRFHHDSLILNYGKEEAQTRGGKEAQRGGEGEPRTRRGGGAEAAHREEDGASAARLREGEAASGVGRKGKGGAALGFFLRGIGRENLSLSF